MSTHTQLNELLNQIRNPLKRNWILMVPSSIGETLVVCSLAKSFIEKHGYGITLVIRGEHRSIAECYAETFDRVVYLDITSMRLFSESGFIPNNFFQIDFPYNTFHLQVGDGRLISLYNLWTNSLGSRGLTFIDLYRYILKLDWSATVSLPVLPKDFILRADEIINKFDIKKNQSVILLLGNNTCKPAPVLLWEKIALNYHKKGYDVIINTYQSMFVPENLNIPFAKNIDLSLDVLVPICAHAGNLVSGSNGAVLFALSFAMDFKVNVLLPNEVCIDWQKPLFEAVDSATGCHKLNVPELTTNNKNLFEWKIPDESEPEFNFDVLANFITNNDKEKCFVLGGTQNS